MRPLLLSLTLAVVAANAAAGEAQEARVPSSPEAQARKVIVEFKDADLTDGQLVQLVKVIASEVPVGSWPEAVVRRDELDIGRLLDRYYDIDSRPTIENALSATARELVGLIEHANTIDANKLSVGQKLRMPPVPVLSLLAAPTDTSVRLFDPSSQTYAVVEGTGDVRAAFKRGSDQSAANIKEARRSEMTAIALSPGAAARLKEAVESDTPASLTIKVPPNHVKVELLQAETCPSVDEALRNSPYYERAKAEIRAKRDLILERGKTRRLALIDFDFESGHGSLVYSAAVWLLDRFEVLALEDQGSLRRIDLNPTSHVKLKEDIPVALLQPTAAYWGWSRVHNVQKASFDDAVGWVLAERPAVSLQGYAVPQFLLQSAVWDALTKREWVNLSWRVEAQNGALPAELQALLDDSGAFVTVAAGNDAKKAVRGDLTPQSAAANFLQFANVTYGVADGRILGSPMSAGGARVDAVANACGFPYRKMKNGTTGSSLASPIVGAAAWLKHLRDETSADQMRRQLVQASLLIEDFKGKVVGSGIFDPARLLANVGAHYLNQQRTKLTEITVKDLLAEGCGRFTPKDGWPQDFIVGTNDHGQHRLVRRYEVEGEMQPRIDVCEPSALVLNATHADGTPVLVNSLETFKKVIGLLTF
jgi:hypothetical protein